MASPFFTAAEVQSPMTCRKVASRDDCEQMPTREGVTPGTTKSRYTLETPNSTAIDFIEMQIEQTVTNRVRWYSLSLIARFEGRGRRRSSGTTRTLGTTFIPTECARCRTSRTDTCMIRNASPAAC